MKLKTLKDLQKDCEWKYDTFIALKQEAIKHYKQIHNSLIGERGHLDHDVCVWIKDFFNLTEEDLK